MKVSARNTLMGIVKDLDIGDIRVEVSIEVTESSEIKILIPTNVLNKLNIRSGDDLEVVIDSRSIVLVKENK